MPEPNERLVRFSDDEVERLAKFYTEAEREILAELNRALLKGNKTEYLRAMQANVRAILKDLREGSRTWCELAIPRIYTEGAKSAETMLEAKSISVAAGFGGIHQQAAQVLAESAYNRFDEVAATIGRRVDDIYRTLALENIRGSVAGYKTWEQAARRYREQLADQGVTGFKDVKGRQWNMRTYTEMVARTTTMEAHLQGTANRLIEHGNDLVKVSSHSGACEKCVPWQGKILSLTGKTKGYPTLQEAKAAGLFHPRCKHAYGLYINFEEHAKESGGKDIEKGNKESPMHYVDIPGLPEAAKMGMVKTFEDALEFGLRTGNECLHNIDNKTGAMVYSRIEGERSQVALPQELLDLLQAAETDSIISIHNHPSSSSFSYQDIGILVANPSISHLTVVGHNGTRYVVRCGQGDRPSYKRIVAEYQGAKQKHFNHFCNEVKAGRMTERQAWREHSHLIIQDVADEFGWEYRRVLPDER